MGEWKEILNALKKRLFPRSENPDLQIAAISARVKVELCSPKGNLDTLSRGAATKSKGWSEGEGLKKIKKGALGEEGLKFYRKLVA